MMNFKFLYPNRTKAPNRSGFTLIEMAVVLVIVGIIISIMATVLPSLIKSAKVKKTRAILEKMDYAIRGKLISDQKLPYADSDKDGIADDSVYYGWLPYKNLGLSSGDDTWGNRLKYGVHEDVVSIHLCDISFPESPDTSKLHTVNHDDGSPTQQVYVIISSGESGTSFEGRNTVDDAEYDDPNRIVEYSGGSVVYDDLMEAGDISTLKGIVCSGGGGGSGCDGVESVYCGNCDDGEDNDGDTLPDCDDPDCDTHPKCANPECDIATSTTLPSGYVNSDYTGKVEFTTSDGCIGSYEWELISNGGFTDFYIHPYTGALSGTLSQCPDTYTIKVGVTDSDADNDPDPEKDFTIEVTSNLGVSGSTDITWDDPNHEETYEVTGGHISDIEWTLTTDGADGFTIDPTGDTCIIKKLEGEDGETTTGAKEYSFVLTAKDSDCPSSNTAEFTIIVTVTPDGIPPPPPPEGMEAEWQFDECTEWDGTSFDVVEALDPAGDERHYGKAINGTFAVYSGKICRAAYFDGTNYYISVDSTDELNQTAAFSIALWVKVDANASNWVRLAGKGDHPNHNYGLWLATNGTILFHIDSASGEGRSQTTMTINDGNWHHVVGVYDFTTMKVYIDNVERKSVNYSHTPYTSTDPFTMGYDGQYTYLNGYLDEVMLFNVALPATHASETSVDTIYNRTRSCTGSCYTDPVAEYWMDEDSWIIDEADDVKDSSGNGHHGTPHGSAAINKTDKHLCYAGEFSNGDSYIEITNLSDLSTSTGDQVTVTFWMKWLGGDSEMPIGWTTYDLWFAGDCFGFNTGNGDIYGISDAAAKLANDWHHIAAVFTNSGTTQNSIFIDGEEQFLDTVRGSSHGNRTVGSTFLISGWTNSTGYKFNGLIDELRIYNRGLAENEIKTDKEMTRDCIDYSIVSITTISLPDGTINSSYNAPISATGGTPPYGWEIIGANPISGLSLDPLSGTPVYLTDTINECAGDYDYTFRVTDSLGSMYERTLTLTVANGTLTVSPSSGTHNCTTSDFSRDFSVSGPRSGALENWTITWLGSNPGGFEVISTGDATVKFRKSGISTAGTGYKFKLTANDSVCTDNTVDSGYNYTLNVSGDGTEAPYYAGRLGEWWLDELSGPVIEDHSGQGNDGTASGGITYGVQGKVWTALEFDGSSGYIDCGNNASLDIDTGDFTVGAWVKLPAVPADGYFVDKGTGNLFDGYGLAVIGGKFAFVTDGDGGSGGKVSLTAADSAVGNTWYHVVGVRESGVKTLYINKVAESTQADARELSDSSRPLYIGRAVNDGGYFQGTIDEVVFYNRALSSDEIIELYNQASLVAHYTLDESEGEIYDYSGQDNRGTNYGAEYGVTGKVGTALDFDGADYVNVGDNEILRSESITISVWAKASALDTWNGIITNKQGAADGINLQMGTSQNIAALVGDGSSYSYIRSTTIPVVDTWYHIVITHNTDDDNNILYVNGTNEKEGVRALAYTAGDTIVGRFYRSSLPFKGIIDEVRIYNRVLSADEVTELYNKGMEEGN